MIKFATRMMAATAALGLVAAPMVASANTRAGDSASAVSAAPGLGRAAGGEGQSEEGDAGALILGLGATAAIVAGVLIATDVIGDDEGDCASPGAC